MKNKYELTLLLKTSASVKDREKLTGEIKKYIKDGKLVKDQDLGKRFLAYSIAKEKEANYSLLVLEMQGSDVSSLSKALKMNNIILRHLFVKVIEKKKKDKKSSKKE
jgi:small subunit ribosomal protein S6